MAPHPTTDPTRAPVQVDLHAARGDADVAAMRIPFNKPVFVGTEHVYLRQAFGNLHTSGDGPFTGRCAAVLREATGARAALLTPSCTHALEMAALLMDVKPGDEVIVPSFTFVSTVNAFVLRGARPVFCDVRPDTLNMDEAQLEALITPNTRALVPVHYAGVGCEMDAIGRIACKHGVPIVEDNAHGLFGTYRDRPLGSFGVLATQSFHETKNFSCGEGGALLVNDERITQRAEIIRDKGTNRKRYFRGEVDKYTWVDVGSSYVMSDTLAAILYAQLEERAGILARRREVWDLYDAELRPWAAAHGVQLPHVPEYCGQSYHMYWILLPTLEARTALITHLKAADIHAVFHYMPLHLSTMGRTLGGEPGQCPVTESAAHRLLRLPFYYELGRADQRRVIGEIKRFFGGA